MHRLTFTLYMHDHRNPAIQSLNHWHRRWSCWFCWIGSEGPQKVPLFTLGLVGRYPWLEEVSVWLVGVNRRAEVEFMGCPRRVWNWRVTE